MTDHKFKPKGENYFKQMSNLLNEVLQQQLRTQSVLLAISTQINKTRASIDDIEEEKVQEEFLELINHWEEITIEESKARLSKLDDLFSK